MIEIIIILILLVVVYLLWFRLGNIREELAELKSAKISQSVKYGQISEQFMPFMKHYPYDCRDFKFLGMPIDGIHFGKDKIVIIEFKTNKSRMSEKQKRVKELVEQNKVYFKEVRIQ